MLFYVLNNIIIPILLGVLSAWMYDSIKLLYYQNAILLFIKENRKLRFSFSPAVPIFSRIR